MPPADSREPARVRYWVLVAWPSFLAASLLEALVFSMVDPGELHWPGSLFQSSRQATYTMAFFAFWLIVMACSGLVLWLAQTAKEVNDNAAE